SAGREESDVPKLAALAERFAIPVVQRKHRYMCLAHDHPMNIGYDLGDYFDGADVIVVLESDVPWIPKSRTPKADAKIIHIGMDPLLLRYPWRGSPCALGVPGIVAGSLPLLSQALAAREKNAAARIDARRKRIAQIREKLVARQAANLEKAKNAAPIH